MTDDNLEKVDRAQISYLPVSHTDSEKSEWENINHVHKFAYEENKPVLEKGPNLLAYWIHILPLGCTAAILQLSFRNVYWADDSNWTANKWSLGLTQEEVANILQFPAKLHEIFIVVSLSTIIFSVIRRRLIGHRGVPFGLLMGGYQIGSVEYLFSGGFWGPFTHAIRHKKLGVFGLALCIGLGIVYANVVGPCSAVLIVPAINWWAVSDPFNGQSLTSYVAAQRTDLYPLMLPESAINMYANYSDCFTANMSSLCPGGGGIDLQDLATAYANEGIAPNITMSSKYGRTRRELSAVHTQSQNGNTLLIASTLHADITEVVGLFWHYVSTKNQSGSIYSIGQPKLQPSDPSNTMSSAVQVQCNHFDLYGALNGDYDVTFPSDLLTGFASTGNKTGPPVPHQYWKFDQPYNGTNFTWIDLQNIAWDGQTVSSSIGALASVPYRSSAGSGDDEVTTQETLLVACVLDARWAATEIELDPKHDDVIASNISDARVFSGAPQNRDLRAQYGLSDVIPMSTEWASLLNAPGITTHTKSDYILDVPAIEAMMYQFIAFGDDYIAPHGGRASDEVLTSYAAFQPPSWNREQNYEENTAETIATILSLAVADGLSRVSYSFYVYEMILDDRNPNNYTVADLLTQAGESDIAPDFISQNDINEKQWMPLTFTVQRYGWGYGTHSKTVKFAISILLLHAALAVGYILYGLFHWMLVRWSSTAWREVGEIVALAMLSGEPRSLKGTGAGIKKWDTWKLDVQVRERGNDRVQLVFGGRHGEPAAGDEGRVRRKMKYM